MRDLSSVLWIGGPPGAGKTTVARLLTRRRGLRWYSADARTWEHRDRAIAAGHPAAIRWEAMTPAQRWSAPPQDMLAMSLHAERGPMVVDDLRALPAAPLTVAEGTTVMPSVAGVSDQAVWLLPSAQVQQARLAQRSLSAGVLKFYLWLTGVIEWQVTQSGARTLITDGCRDIGETVAQVESVFAAALDAGPVAATATERQYLLRYANRALVAQCMGFFARPWAPGDGRAAVLDFACECGQDGCQAQVRLAAGDFPALPEATSAPVLAAGHRAGSDAGDQGTQDLP